MFLAPAHDEPGVFLLGFPSVFHSHSAETSNYGIVQQKKKVNKKINYSLIKSTSYNVTFFESILYCQQIAFSPK